VYRWESRWLDWCRPTTSLQGCRWLARKACRAYGVTAPRVTSTTHAEFRKANVQPYSSFEAYENRILLLDRHLNPACALHETAHAIVWHRFGHQRLDHGPTWLGIYLWLLTEYKVAPLVALEASAKADGLDFVGIDESSPKTIRGE
jgi:hypothetical protein